MTNLTDLAENRSRLISYFYFDESKIDFDAVLWLCESESDVHAVPANGVAIVDEDAFSACKNFVESFPAVFVAIPNRAARNGFAEALRCFGFNVLLPKNDGVFRGCKTLCDMALKFGDDAVAGALMGAREAPAAFLIDVADIEPPGERSFCLSGIRTLDRTLGGFARGELTVWTGRRGCGKSTMLSQVMLEAVSENAKVFVFSGELSASRVRQWMCQQAAGSGNLVRKTDPRSGLVDYAVVPQVERRICEWLKGRLYIYDTQRSNACDADSILDAAEFAVRSYGVSVLVLDNLMTVTMPGRGDDFFRQQSAFVGRLTQFAKKNNVHIHLVAHPRKADGRRLTADDVGGSGDITNRCDNCIAVERSESDEERYDARLTILKNRFHGKMGTINLAFDTVERRFYEVGDTSNKCYGWEQQ